MSTRKDNGRWAAKCAVRFMKALRSKLEDLTDDEEAIRDTIEGATDVDPVMETLIGLRQEAKAMAASRKQLAKAYSEAAAADEAKAEKIETLILEALQASGQPSWKGVAGTASIRAGGVSCEVYDPAQVPLQYMRPVPDIARIKADLSGEEVGGMMPEIPGAHLVRGEDTLMIRLPSHKAEPAEAS